MRRWLRERFEDAMDARFAMPEEAGKNAHVTEVPQYDSDDDKSGEEMDHAASATGWSAASAAGQGQ